MKLFRCSCESKPILYFENDRCGSCHRMTGFCAESMELKPFVPVHGHDVSGEESAASKAPKTFKDDHGREYFQCANWNDHQVCNWMVPKEPSEIEDVRAFADDPEGLCAACRLNDVIPNLSIDANIPLWHLLEKAKRRCIFTLFELGLPVVPEQLSGTAVSELPLSFRFMADRDSAGHFQSPIEGEDPVFTGHSDGVITINLAEADEIARTQAKVAMQERYRTLLGHFRHESGHYYWDVFRLLDSSFVAKFRDVFGDENASYKKALDRHYKEGPPVDWQDSFVSAYATMHPWEDWAETWSHYLHIVDTLETQQSFSHRTDLLSDSVRDVGLPFLVGSRDNTAAADFDKMMALWIQASIVLNSLNRSMGLPDPYPFVLHKPIQDKLRFIHDTIMHIKI